VSEPEQAPAPASKGPLTPADPRFAKECLDALHTLGKTLGQMNLYKVGHPAVVNALASCEVLLRDALGQVPEGLLTFSIDNDKLIANGRIIGNTGQVPNAIIAFFNRFKLNNITIKAGLEVKDLQSFCELSASRPDSEAAKDPQAYLEKAGVTHITLAETVYTKMSEEQLLAALQDKSLDETINLLVANAVPNPKQQKQVLERVRDLIKHDIEKRLDEVVRPLREERNVAANESARTQSVIENMAEGVVVVDEQGKILMMNPAAEELYGARLSQVAGQLLAEKAGEEHVVTLAAEIATPKDRPIKKEVQLTGDGETRKTIKHSSAVVQNEAGKVVGVVSTFTDVAKQKELQKMEREFVAHVTHELRAPLSSIKAALDILNEEFFGKLADDGQRMLKAARVNSDRLENLINGILDFSKIESGQMTVHPLPVDPERMGSEALESMKPWATRKSINFVLESQAGLPMVLADSVRSVQILINLISNAIKFTPSGGKITIGVKLSPKEKAVEFSVKDTGPGIPPEEHKRIFEKFVQIAAGQMHVGGTGLGLAIAKALVHMQGGKMWLESAVGSGSTFFFTVPIYETAQIDRSAAKPPPPPERPWWKTLLGLD
jgi:two-component system, OmpR family, phosphate regulon sensor histidine kinase PhoR